MLEWSDYAKMLISLLVIVDPLGIIPIFISITTGHSVEDRRHIAKIACIAMGAVFLATVIVGDALLKLFGISIASFKVGGGILLLLMAIAMLQAKQSRSKHTPEEDREAEDKEAIAIVPLAIPLLSGPGAISTIIIFSNQARTAGHLTMVGIICLLAVILSWLALRASETVSRLLGKTGINIAMRLMGLLLAAIAVEFMASGLSELLPGLRG